MNWKLIPNWATRFLNTPLPPWYLGHMFASHYFILYSSVIRGTWSPMTGSFFWHLQKWGTMGLPAQHHWHIWHLLPSFMAQEGQGDWVYTCYLWKLKINLFPSFNHLPVKMSSASTDLFCEVLFLCMSRCYLSLYLGTKWCYFVKNHQCIFPLPSMNYHFYGCWNCQAFF